MSDSTPTKFFKKGFNFVGPGVQQNGETSFAFNKSLDVPSLVPEKMSETGKRTDKLYNAVKNGNLEEVEEELPYVKINEIPLSQFETCLSIATEQGHQKIVELLIKNGADANQVGKNGKSPIFFAVTKGHLEIVKLLIGKGANFNIVDNSGNTPLAYSIQEGQLEIIKLLLDEGANVSKVGTDGKPPLSWAVCNGNTDLIKLLLIYGAEFTLHTAFLEAISCRNLTIIKFLIEQGALVNGDDIHGYTPLIKAIETEHFEIVKYLIELGANVNQKDCIGRTPLSIAAANYDLRTFDYLVKAGADIALAFSELEKMAKNRMDAASYLDRLKKDIGNYIKGRPAEVRVESDGQEEAPVS